MQNAIRLQATSHTSVVPPVYPKMWSVRAGLFPPGARAKRAEGVQPRAEKKLLAKMSSGSEQRVYYVDPDTFADLKDFVQQALRCDWTLALAAELLKTSRIRIIKQAASGGVL